MVNEREESGGGESVKSGVKRGDIGRVWWAVCVIETLQD